MKSAREAGHDAATLVGVCADHYQGTHTKSCDRITAEVEARDREHAEEVERLRAELAASQERAIEERVHANAAETGLRIANEQLDEAAASLATVTADRDVARSDLADSQLQREALQEEKAVLNRMLDKAEAALVASVRREEESAEIEKALRRALDASAGIADVARWLENSAWLLPAPLLSGAGLARRLRDGSWLRDLATMDGRPAALEELRANMAKAGEAVTALQSARKVDPSSLTEGYGTTARPAEAEYCRCGRSREQHGDGNGPLYSGLQMVCEGWRLRRPANKETGNG